jgi:hypothetical protein
MTLTGRQIQQIRDALLSAYTTSDSLSMMVRIELEEELAVIAGGENLRVVIFNLVTWAERNGCIDKLIAGAHNQMPGNPALQELVDQWHAQTLTGVPLPLTSPLVNDARTVGPASVDVFLSYSRKDTEIMHKVQDALRAGGLAVWTDEGLEPGTASWRAAIEESLGQASAVVVLLSPNAKISRWVDNEVGYAQTQHKVVFPILVAGDEASAVPISLINTQWVDGRHQVEGVVRKRLLPTIDRLVHGHTVPPPPVRPSRPWRWLTVEAGVIIVVVAGLWWVLVSFYGFRFVGTYSAPSTTVTSSTATSASTSKSTLVAVASATLASAFTPATTKVTPSAVPTVTLVPPSISHISLSQEGIWRLDGRSHASAIVEVLLDETSVASTLADANGQWLLDVPIGAPGEHAVKVVTEAGSFMTFVLVPSLAISPSLSVIPLPVTAVPVQTITVVTPLSIVSTIALTPTGSSPGMSLATALARSLARPFAKPLTTPVPTLEEISTGDVVISLARSLDSTQQPLHPPPTAASETTPSPVTSIHGSTSVAAPQPIPGAVARPVLIAPENGARHYYSRLTFSWAWPGELPPNWGFEIRAWQQNDAHQAIVDARLTKGIRPNNQGQYSLEITIPPRFSEVEWYWTVVVAQLEPFDVLSDEASPYIIRVETSSTPTPVLTHTPTPTVVPPDTLTVMPSDTPANTPQGEPTNTPQCEPTNTPQGESTNTPQGEPTNTPQGEPTVTSPDKPTDTPPDNPTDTPPDKPTDTPPDKPTDTLPDNPPDTTPDT